VKIAIEVKNLNKSMEIF